MCNTRVKNSNLGKIANFAILSMNLSTILPTVDPVAETNSVDSNFGISRATKKVQTRIDLTFDFDNPTVNSNSQKVLPDSFKPSYKFTLIGESTKTKHSMLEEENFSLLDGDAVTELIDGVPFITFSDCVQEFIKRKILKTIIIKLLGGKIRL